MISIKKAAMFGLDARIALAIFGALSVISGAALYSAIQNAKTEQWRQYLVELVKASEAYYLDNGEKLSIYNSTNQWLYAENLVSNIQSLSTWHGPYINSSYASGYVIRDSMTSSLHSSSYTSVWLRTGSEWTEMNDFNSDEFCVVDDYDCYEWIFVYAANIDQKENILKIFNNLDNLVDNGDGKLKGNVRFVDHIAGAIMYKSIPHKRTS
jgi:type II secretory pathway pseudopilin PulG